MPIVYVSSAGDRRIHVLNLDRTTGQVTPVEVVEVPGPDQTEPISLPLALSADRRFLYAAIRTAPYPASAFAVDQKTGQLTWLGSADLPDGMAYIAPDKTNKFLLQASYTGSKLAVSPIDVTGRIGNVPTEVFDVRRAHCIISSEDNRFAYVASHGDDIVLQYALDLEAGRLRSSDPPGAQTKPEAGPRHLALHAPTQRLYALNERNGSVDSFAIDAATGHLTLLATVSMLPAGYSSVPTAADIHITGDGKLLYASERTESFIASFAVDPPSGSMKLIETVTTEASPRGFAVDSSNRWLLCAGQFSGSMSIYAIDPASGKLKRTDQLPIGPNPNWIEIIDLN